MNILQQTEKDNNKQIIINKNNHIAVEFIKFYYNVIKTNPSLLVDSNGQFLYKEQSIYKLQGQDIKNQKNILETLIDFKNRGINHNIRNIDTISVGSRRIEILVTGLLIIDGITYNFSEVFNIACGNKNSNWWILTNILRIIN